MKRRATKGQVRPADILMNRPGETVRQKSHDELLRLVADPSAGKEIFEQLRRAERKASYFEERPEKDRQVSAWYSVRILESHAEAFVVTGTKVRAGLAGGRARRLGAAKERAERDSQLYAWYCTQKASDTSGRVRSDARIIQQQGRGVLISGSYVRLSNRKLDRLKSERRKS